MVYRKLKANAIFTGQELLDQHLVLVTTEDGSVVDLIPDSKAGEGIEVLDGILSPGFINCHGHLELSHLKGMIPEKTGLVDFVCAVLSLRHFPEDEIQAAISNAEAEMLENGIVAAGDICNNLSTIAQKQKVQMFYHNFIELSGWNPGLAENRFQKSKSTYDAFCHLPAAVHRASMSPHAPYSVSEELWKMISPYFKDNPVTMHNQEAAWEDELFIYGKGDAFRIYEKLKTENPGFRPSGKSSLQTTLNWFNGASRLILVHNTFIHAEDLKFAAKSGFGAPLFFCLCPNANIYVENLLAPIALFRKSGHSLVIGTDSLASNHGLSILEEIKTILHAYPQIPTAEVLQWATLNGARALGFQDRLGSFKQGKKPGVILLENLKDKKITTETTVRRII